MVSAAGTPMPSGSTPPNVIGARCRCVAKVASFRSRPQESRRQQRLGFFFVLIVGLLAGTISGIFGTGSSIMLMPVLIYQYGPKEAVPIMAGPAVVAQPSRNPGRGGGGGWGARPALFGPGISAAAPRAPGPPPPPSPPPRNPHRFFLV